MNSEWKNRYEVAVVAAQQAGEQALAFFSPDLEVTWKEDESPVTLADQNAERLLRETLLKKFPKDGFLGEEFGATEGESGFRWIIDPIDGTRSFVRGLPLWATLVGLEYKGELLAGVAYIPPLKQTYRALRGDGAFKNDRPIQVSNIDRIEKAHLYYSSLSWFAKAGAKEPFLDLYFKTERQRGFGDFYGYVLVAEGAGEIMVEHGVHAWDVAGLIPLLEEAGGKMTAWDGSVDIFRVDSVATNGRLHDVTLKHLPAMTP